MTFHLFVCALAGAGAAVVAMVRQDIKKETSPNPQKCQNTKQWCKLLNHTLARNFPLFTKSKKFAEAQVKLRRYGVNKLWSGQSYCHNCSMCAGARNKREHGCERRHFGAVGKTVIASLPLSEAPGMSWSLSWKQRRRKALWLLKTSLSNSCTAIVLKKKKLREKPRWSLKVFDIMKDFFLPSRLSYFCS